MHAPHNVLSCLIGTAKQLLCEETNRQHFKLLSKAEAAIQVKIVQILCSVITQVFIWDLVLTPALTENLGWKSAGFLCIDTNIAQLSLKLMIMNYAGGHIYSVTSHFHSLPLGLQTHSAVLCFPLSLLTEILATLLCSRIKPTLLQVYKWL